MGIPARLQEREHWNGDSSTIIVKIPALFHPHWSLVPANFHHRAHSSCRNPHSGTAVTPLDNNLRTEKSLSRFLTGLNTRFEPESKNPKLCSVIVDVDENNGNAISIERCDVGMEDLLEA